MQDIGTTSTSDKNNNYIKPINAVLLLAMGASIGLFNGLIENSQFLFIVGAIVFSAGLIVAALSVKRSKFIVFLPLIFLGALAALFIWGLKFNPNGPKHIPSALIGKKIDFTLEKMDGLNGPDDKPMATFSSSTLANGEVSIVNVWASWCLSCRAEHRFLDRLAKRSSISIYGLNYKDTASAGRKFLARFGNPYKAVGMDRRGRVGIDFGVYGVPETFVIDGKGIIRYKIPGPVNAEIIERQLLPAIKKAQALSSK